MLERNADCYLCNSHSKKAFVLFAAFSFRFANKFMIIVAVAVTVGK